MKTNAKTQNKNTRSGAYLQLVERIYQEPNKPARYNGTIESMLREFFAQTSKTKYSWKRATFRQLLITMYDQKCYALLRDYQCVAVMHSISAFGNRLVREVDTWKKDGSHAYEQAESMVKHCFEIYEAPKFLLHSFFSSEKKHMLWYVQLARGKSVKSLSNMPIELSSKMAHEFRNAPSFFSVNEALRFAQARGLGATVKTAQLIAFSRLANRREDQEAFWAKAVAFFSKEEDLKVNEVDEILDYLLHKYRENTKFSFKGRTFSSLKAQSEQWHQEVVLKEQGGSFKWKPSGITPLYFSEYVNDKKVVYKTEELLSSVALYEEGKEMHHCVAEYDTECEEGQCSIFSLQREIEGQPVERLATLEIELPSKMIVQAKAKYNDDPDPKAKELIDRWVKNSQVVSQSGWQHQQAYVAQRQPQAAARFAERRGQANSQDANSVWAIKVIIWILYFLFKMFMLM